MVKCPWCRAIFRTTIKLAGNLARSPVVVGGSGPGGERPGPGAGSGSGNHTSNSSNNNNNNNSNNHNGGAGGGTTTGVDGPQARAIHDWEEALAEADGYSFDDSDRFEEDSLCSWSSEAESLINHWRGWRRLPAGFGISKKSEDKQQVPTLCELSARCVASHIPFELVEHVYPPVPEQLQLRIAFWSFPDNEEDIRLYSCLANGSADEFQRGENLFRTRSVKDILQIGFHLSATINTQICSGTVASKEPFKVSVTFDRRRITSCNCTCTSAAYWCSHVVAVCLYRIHLSSQVCLRAPVSESLSRLHRDQLQKFAQYLISELPQQILPTAQRLLDELLSTQPSAINIYCGAPDPTAGASAHDQTTWYLDEKTLHGNIKKILIKFCVPAPIVFSDVNYLSTTAPPAATEWTSLLRPLRGREPEGMWNLLSIVREMFKRTDRNAIPLLEIITEECMACEQFLVWWFNTKIALLNGTGHGGGKHGSMNSNAHASQHACSSLCDEIVVLWRLAALNPGLSPSEREMLHGQFTAWHMKVIDKVTKSRGSVSHNTQNRNHGGPQKDSLKTDIEVFTGFKPALEACYLDWDEYTLPGITYTAGSNPMYHCPFTCFRHAGDSRTEVNQVNSSAAVLNCQPPNSHHHSRRSHCVGLVDFSYMDRKRLNSRDFPGFCSRNNAGNNAGNDGNRSSVSSEGFCENDADISNIPSFPLSSQVDLVRREYGELNNCGDTDSQEGGGSESSSNSNVSLKNAQGSDKHRSNASSETHSDSSDSCNNKVANDPKCSTLCRAATSASTSTASAAPNKIPPVNNNKRDTAECSLAKDPLRRPSKDESSSSSSDSPSGDEYNFYYYDSKAMANMSATEVKDAKNDGPGGASASAVLGNLRKTEDPWDILFARAEGLYAHGHTREACILSVKLAEELLSHPPDLMIEVPPVLIKGKRKKQPVNPASHQLTCLASATLAKCAFLCTVLMENFEHHNLAFRVGLFGLEMARPPASTKPLEVKLAHQESELVGLLKRIPLGPAELAMLRQRAEQLRDGILRSRGHALLPIMLASLIFDALNTLRMKGEWSTLTNEDDENLGFDAAVAALGLKANVSEADHPLLCEGTRRQRGDLAITLLLHYKDEPTKVAKIMDKLLDREIHQLIKTPIVSSYYSSNPPTKSQLASFRRAKVCSSPLTGTDVSGSGDGIAGTSSRPHSSTSAELEAGMSALTVQPQTSQPPVSTRTKETRYKCKKVYPSIPNQPSEAGAHFMCELAKIVLLKAGGSSSTSLFTQPSTNQNHHGPHRALHMCAFQIGLYALGLHNCVSPNWLSRTYSSHVSWITGQAMEIGAPAIWFLIDSWEGHLTPPEAVSIADKSSRGSDPNMVRAAAELALSCLPHAHALNPNEIQRAILQCKEQSDLMLEKACIMVENTAKGGGVYPEVLFQVAKYWYELYLRHTPGGEQQDDIPHDHLQLDPNGALIVEPGQGQLDLNIGQMMPGPTQTVVVTSTQPPPQPYPPHPTMTTLVPGVGLPYTVGPYSFVHPHHPIPAFGGQMPPHRVALPPAPPHMQMYHAAMPPHQVHPQHQRHPPPVTQPPPVQQYYPQPTVTTVNVHPLPGGHHMFGMQQPMPVNVPQEVAGSMPGHNGMQGPAMVQAQPIISTVRPQPQVHRQSQPFSPQQLRPLVAAYRVGMLALETLARRVHDDRPQAKYARNPPYGEDVKWLLRISKRLGTQCFNQLCMCTVNSIVSPFVLHDVALEAATFHSRSNPAMFLQHLRSALLAPIVHKCQQMYIQCMHHKLYHLMSGEYEEFASIVCAARAAFHITPEGHTQFKEWLQSMKRSPACNKELWAQINAALQSNNK
ncbi:zinc finger SWIM domain-containing protein 8 homolog [Microplitis demolitor]|uniref:zinc finger SWIM domain-containing protein 8 homolog n=1 Tax=Microplitis demolitor TaxID=69319 RepID=UPI00235B5F55|nr:zinc finger SWIM domain-containing protein 8 homolog [Microplitis demolitor]